MDKDTSSGIGVGRHLLDWRLDLYPAVNICMVGRRLGYICTYEEEICLSR